MGTPIGGIDNWRSDVFSKQIYMSAAGAMVLCLATSSAMANDIHTGGDRGAYQSVFCPLLKKRIAAVGGEYNCKESFVSRDNISKVRANPTDFGFAQLDVFALQNDSRSSKRPLVQVRSDDARECVFAVTRNKNLTNYGEVAVYADRLKFILPAKNSGSASTFSYLAKIDPSGLGRAKNIVYASNTDEAINSALQDDHAVTFFVQFPDPSNKRFQAIRRMGGHLVPVVDGVFLKQKVDGEQIYFAQETQISQIPWLRAGRTVITACTPMVLFTGDSNQIGNTDQRLAHRQLIENIRAMPSNDLVPQGSVYARLLKQTRQASSNAKEYFLRISRNARLRAKPFLERMWRYAGEVAETMVNKAQPAE